MSILLSFVHDSVDDWVEVRTSFYVVYVGFDVNRLNTTKAIKFITFMILCFYWVTKDFMNYLLF